MFRGRQCNRPPGEAAKREEGKKRRKKETLKRRRRGDERPAFPSGPNTSIER